MNESERDGDGSIGDDFNALAFFAQFFSDETSITRNVGGEDQLYTQKKFHHGPHRCFLDLEVRSNVPLMLNYYLLSAVATEKEKIVYYSRCWIEHRNSKKRYIVLAVFRSKCLHIRYEFLLYDPDNDTIFLLCEISKVVSYVWLPDVELDHAHAKEQLKRYICDPQHRLALIPGTPDKDEYGHFIVDGFDPLAAALDGGGGKRKRKPAQSGTNTVAKPNKPNVKPTPNKSKPKVAPKAKPKAIPKEKTQTKPLAKKPRKGNSAKEVRILLSCYYNF